MHHINLFDCIFLFTLFTWVVHCYMIWLYMHLYIHSYFNIITCLYMYLISIFDGNFIFTLFTGVLHCSMIWLYMHLYIHSYFCVIGIWSLATLVDMWHSKIDVGQVAVHYSPSTTGVTFSLMRSLEVTIFSLVNMVPVYSSWHVTFYNLFGSSSWSIYTLYYRCHFFSDEVTRGNNILSCQSDHQFLLNNFHWRFFLYNCPWLNNLLHWRISLVFLHWRISPVFLHWRISPLKNFSTEEFSPVKNLLTIYYSIS